MSYTEEKKKGGEKFTTGYLTPTTPFSSLV